MDNRDAVAFYLHFRICAVAPLLCVNIQEALFWKHSECCVETKTRSVIQPGFKANQETRAIDDVSSCGSFDSTDSYSANGNAP